MELSLISMPGFIADYDFIEQFTLAKEEKSSIILERINQSPKIFGQMLDSLACNQKEVDELNQLLYRIANENECFDVAIELRDWLRHRVAIELRDWLRNHAVLHSELLASFSLKHPELHID